MSLPVMAYVAVGCTNYKKADLSSESRRFEIPTKVTREDLKIINTAGPTNIHRFLKREKILGLKVPDQYFEEFEELCAEAKGKISKLGLLDKDQYSKEEAKSILEVFGEIIDRRYPFDEAKFTSILARAFRIDKSVCLQRSAFYISLNNAVLKNPLKLSAVKAPRHMFIRLELDGKGNYLNWETTKRDKDKSISDKEIKEWLSITKGEIKRGNFMKSLTKNEFAASHLKTVGSFLANQGRRREAIFCYDLALLLDPKEQYALYGRGIEKEKLKDYNGAIKDYTDAILVNEDHARSRFLRGDLFYDLGKYQEALEDFNRAIEIKPKKAKNYNMRGLTYLKLGKKDLARKDFKKATELDPSEEVFKYNLGSIDANVFWYIANFFGLN